MTPFQKRKDFLGALGSLKSVKKEKAKDIPDDLFIKCPSCKKMMEKEQVLLNFNVCPNCNHHFFVSAYTRLNMIFDDRKYKELDKNLIGKNPIDFPDYEEKLEHLREKHSIKESVVTATGKISGEKAVVCVMDTRFLMGSMGTICGEKITRATEYATKNKLPIIIFTASGGARMQEGILSLFQMAKTSAALKKHADEKLLYITVLTHPTTGGVTASFAMLGDIIMAEPNALIGFAGPRVIEQTIGEKLPNDAQKAQYVMEHGFVDLIANRNQQKEILARFIKTFRRGE